MLLGTVVAAAVDQHGFDRAGPADRSALIADIFGGYRARSDLDADGTLSARDLSRWLEIMFAGGSCAGAGSMPGGVCP